MNKAKSATQARKQKTLWLVETAMLSAIVILLSITPLGYLKTPLLEITFMMIPVAVASVAVGPMSGAIVGGVFGITSFLQCIGVGGYSVFGGVLFSISPIFTIILCIPTRILAGLLPGCIAKAMSKIDKTKILSSIVASLSAALLNTLFFVSTFALLFGSQWQTVTSDLETAFELALGTFGITSLFDLLVFIVGTNGIIEAIVTAIVGSAISIALIKALKRRFN